MTPKNRRLQTSLALAQDRAGVLDRLRVVVVVGSVRQHWVGAGRQGRQCAAQEPTVELGVDGEAAASRMTTRPTRLAQ